MTAFLRQVAAHYYSTADMSSTAFVLPNRRSLTFFRKHLCDLAREESRTMVLPRLLTVSDFYTSVSCSRSADRITLLSTLYSCYQRLNPHAEPFDDFIYWGDVILADFSDIDRYKVDARILYSNLTDLGELKDDFSHASKTQLEAIEALRGHFSAEQWKKHGEHDAKSDFLSIWGIMYQLYESFRSALRTESLSYGGMACRDLAESLDSRSVVDVLSEVWPDMRQYVFVGLNAISTSEAEVMRRMKSAGLAQFCWDFSSDMLTDPGNPAYEMMRRNIDAFGNDLALDPDGLGRPHVHVVSVPSASGQAKLLPAIIDQVPVDLRGLDFAVVLADESLLMPVLGSIPDGIDNVNITMGYPLAQSEWAAFIKDLLALQLNIRRSRSDGVLRFYHKHVTDILSSGIVRSVLEPEEADAMKALLAQAKIYLTPEDFGEGLPGQIFRIVVEPGTDVSPEAVARLADYLLEITDVVASRLGEDSVLQREFAMRYYRCIKRLKSLGLSVRPRTWAHLLEQTIAGESVPFEGEPLSGMQVMGPLETRALDFRNIVILNANEGVFPRRSISPSFITAELRVAFGLPTYRDQDAVWAYYFYRLIGRADNVWMLYDSRAEGLNSGEESRYCKQLRYVFADRCELDEAVAGARITESVGGAPVVKTSEDLKAMSAARYSASTLSKYLSCQLQFYYYVVCNLKSKEEVKESLDSGLIGTVCHDTLQALYSQDSEAAMASDEDFDKRNDTDEWPPEYDITAETLRSWLNRKDAIRRKVHSIICRKLRCPEVTGRDLVTAEVAVRFVLRVLEADIKLIEHSGRGVLHIIALERKLQGEICGHRFLGYVDRIDSLHEGTIRIVDYKSGGDDPKVLSDTVKASNLFDSNAHKNKAALQFFVYDTLLEQTGSFEGCKVYNSMYAMSDIFSSPVESYLVRDDFVAEVEAQLSDMFGEMADIDTAFTPTTDTMHTCRWCDYKTLCGKYSKD